MHQLGVGAGVVELADVVGQQPRRGRLGGAVGQHERDRLVVEDAVAELFALERPLGSDLDQPVTGAAAAGRDVHPLLDEPLRGQLEPLPHLAQHAVQRQRRVGERELGVAIGEVVGEVGVVGHLDAGQILVDDEQRRLALQPVHRPRQHQEVAGDVTVGDEPLLARQPVAVTVAHRLGADRARVGAGLLLGDRVGVPMLAADVGKQVALDLVGAAVDEHVGGAPDQHPETIGQPSQLLVHDDLLGQVEAAAAVLGGDVGGVQAGVQHRPLDAGVSLRRQPPVALLGLELERLEHVVDERADA